MELDNDQRQLIRQLFATATMIASVCEEWAIAGQMPGRSINEYDVACWMLGKSAQGLIDLQKGLQAAIKLYGNEISGSMGWPVDLT